MYPSKKFSRGATGFIGLVGLLACANGTADDPVDDRSNQGGETQRNQGGSADRSGGDDDNTGGMSNENDGGEGGAGGEQAPSNNGGAEASGGMAGGTAGSAPDMTGGNGGANVEPPNCGHPFCTDFESDQLGEFPGAPLVVAVASENKLTVSRGKAASGNQSLRLDVRGHNAEVRLSVRSLKPENGRSNYVRFKYFLENHPGPMASIVSMDGPAQLGSKRFISNVSLRQDGGGARMVYWAEGNTGTEECWITGPNRLPTGRWACVEMAIDAGSGQAYSVKLDGQPMGNFTFGVNSGNNGCGLEGQRQMEQRFIIPDVFNVRMGWRTDTTSHSPTTMWIDDIAFDTEPIGCN